MGSAVDPLVAAVIHDAKNALLVLDTQLADIQRRAANADFSHARATAHRIAGQLAELLTLYRAQNGQLRLAIDDHDLTDFAADLLDELGPVPPHLTLHIDNPAAASLGSWAFDAYLVRLVLLDALRNALRHARSVITLTLRSPDEGGLCLEVGDDGPGFPEPVLSGAVVAAEQAGTGLGLSFARLIAGQHAAPAGRHGRLSLENRDGARFPLYLP